MRTARSAAASLRVASLPLAILAAALAAAPAAASTTLRWQQPAGSPPVSEFRVYAGSDASGPGQQVFRGLPTPDAGGVYSATVTIPALDLGQAAYVWVTAANAAGESTRSNVRRKEPPTAGGPTPGATDTGGKTGDGLRVPFLVTGSVAGATGSAELRQGDVDLFTVTVLGLPDSVYGVYVGGAKRGDLSVAGGTGTLRFSSAPAAGELLLDFAVKGLAVEVRVGDASLLGRLFPTDLPSALGRYAPETRSIQMRIGLANARVDLDATGSVEWRTTNGVEQLRVAARDLPPGTYRLFVDGTERGSAVADTRGSLRLDLGATTRPPQPLGFEVLGATLELRDDAGAALLVGTVE
jgi:hypothetical protein